MLLNLPIQDPNPKQKKLDEFKEVFKDYNKQINEEDLYNSKIRASSSPKKKTNHKILRKHTMKNYIHNLRQNILKGTETKEGHNLNLITEEEGENKSGEIQNRKISLQKPKVDKFPSSNISGKIDHLSKGSNSKDGSSSFSKNFILKTQICKTSISNSDKNNYNQKRFQMSKKNNPVYQ